MRRKQAQVRVRANGMVEVVDPALDSLPFLTSIDPTFRVEHDPLPGFSTPGVLACKRSGTGIPLEALDSEDEAGLWSAHRRAVDSMKAGRPAPPMPFEATLLELKTAIARRVLGNCRLCAHRCGVDRSRTAAGRCGLGPPATVAEHFVHVAEEAVINPSLVLSLAGCGLRCRYCQQGWLLDAGRVAGDALEPALWDSLDRTGARSLSFVGGNPDENLPAVFEFLAGAPQDFDLPVVWNSHAYSSPETLALLDGVVDVYLPDLKYGDDACARRWSAIDGYVEAARAAVEEMVRQGAAVVVRILVLPGHVECCHRPTLEFLAQLDAARLFLSIRDQYAPDWKIEAADGAMAFRASETPDPEAVFALAERLWPDAVDGVGTDPAKTDHCEQPDE